MTVLRSMVIVSAALVPAAAQAQHHHHGHGHGDAHGMTRAYSFYVPAHRHGGGYYLHNDVHYYVPVAVASAIVEPQPIVARFGGYSHVDDLSSRLETLANSFCLDLHFNYQHNPGFAETYREAYQILTTAKYIHGSEHAGDREAIRETVGRLDNLFHHVVDDVRPWTRHTHREIGLQTFGGKINEMEALIHHLMYDVGVKPAHDEASAQAPPPATGTPSPVPPPPTAPFRTVPQGPQITPGLPSP